MPRLTIQNTEYVFYFSYGWAYDLSGRRWVEIASCYILAGPAGCRDDEKPCVGYGEAVRHPRDTPNRRTARTFALHRAISEANLPKKVSDAFWNEINFDGEAMYVLARL